MRDSSSKEGDLVVSPSSRQSRRLWWQVVIVGASAAALIVAALNWNSIAYRVGLPRSGSGATISSSVSPSLLAQATSIALGPATPVATPTPGVMPTPEVLAARLAKIGSKGAGTVAGVVLDAETGTQLYAVNATTALIPASNLKLLTATAALQLLGPDATVETTVVQTAPGEITLVGGGDPLLTSTTVTSGYPRPASLQQLAAQTATALKAAGTTSVRLSFDDSAFVEPGWQPTWPDSYASAATPISALSADGGRIKGTSETDPAASAAATFATQLAADGITVTGSVVRAKAPATTTKIAAVTSLPLETEVEYALLHSDNVVTETIARKVAIAAGQPASFAGGVTAVIQTLTSLGISLDGVTMVDGSGLSRSNRATATVLADVIEKVLADDRFSAVRAGLPVAGATGTMTNRLRASAAAVGEGWVHAKTGTLTGVSSLTGYTRTVDGRVVVFALIANGGNDQTMRDWLDEMAATITGCGC